jgi:diacylglycerol kinase (ATP)
MAAPSESLIAQWINGPTSPFDVGRIEGLSGTQFFLESFGYGLFPHLIHHMKKQDNLSPDTPEKELERTLAAFEKLISSYQAQHCQLEVDGEDYSGRYLLVEVMNIRSIGPNLAMAPDADPGDGWLDVVLVQESQREELAEYVSQKRRGASQPYRGYSIKAKNIRLLWADSQAHIDDELIQVADSKPIRIDVQPGLLEFLGAKI